MFISLVISEIQIKITVCGSHYRKPQLIKMQSFMDLSPNGTSKIQSVTLRLRQHCEERVERLWESEDQGVCYEIVSPVNVRSYTRRVS